MATKIKMERTGSDIDLQVANQSKSMTSFIEWNVDMNVTVSNVKRSKVFQRSRNIVIFLLAIAFAIVLSHLKREVRALQVQMQCVNVNLLVLMSKYDKLNRSLNRAWLESLNKYYETKSTSNIRNILEEASLRTETSQLLSNMDNTKNEVSYAYNSVVPFLSPIRGLKDKLILNDLESTQNENAISTNYETLINNEIIVDKPRNNLRSERAIMTFEKQNSTATDILLDDDKNTRTDEEVDDDSDGSMDHRSGRSRRDEGRGKKRGKNRRRPKRSRRRLGPQVATFVGAIPEQHITDSVYIGPWVKSTKNDSQYSLNKFHLVEDKKSIEVTTNGLYMISTQIFYFGEPTNYSYWILLTSEGKSTTKKLVKCSTASSTSATEVSCYTSIITLLRKGDRLHIQQQERDRFINMREGHSYIQLVLLSNNIHKRRLT